MIIKNKTTAIAIQAHVGIDFNPEIIFITPAKDNAPLIKNNAKRIIPTTIRTPHPCPFLFFNLFIF